MKRNLLLCAEIVRWYGNGEDGAIETLAETSTVQEKLTEIFNATSLLLESGYLMERDDIGERPALTMKGWDFYAYATNPLFIVSYEMAREVFGDNIPLDLLMEVIRTKALGEVWGNEYRRNEMARHWNAVRAAEEGR